MGIIYCLALLTAKTVGLENTDVIRQRVILSLGKAHTIGTGSATEEKKVGDNLKSAREREGDLQDSCD